MNNNVKEIMSSIKIPKHLREAAKHGVERARLEQQHSKRLKWRWKAPLIAIASILVVIIVFIGIKGMTERDNTHSPSLAVGNDVNIEQTNNNTIDHEKVGIVIPTITLPENSETADMIGLVVYKGRIYTQTSTSIDIDNAKKLKGEKLGTTKGNIDEWSSQNEYAQELASTIGVQSIYAVNDYDTDFRIMTYLEDDEGNVYAEFYECLNGYTVYSGADIFGQLNMTGNIKAATYEIYSDWYYSTEKYNPISDIELLNTFVTELNEAKPYAREVVEEELGEFRNNDQYRHLSLTLSDGTIVTLNIVREGYVRYGYADVYFKLEGDTFQNVWALIDS